MNPFWILIILANAFTMVGIISREPVAFGGSLLFIAAAFLTLALGGAR